MKGNELYLVCKCCEENGALRLGKRSRSLYVCGKRLDLDDFFKLHESCGAGPDHFALAHALPMDYDVASPVECSVQTALQ